MTLQAETLTENGHYLTRANEATRFSLKASSSTGAPLRFSVVEAPQRGQISGTLPDLIYQPDPGFQGTDYLIFEAQDASGEPARGRIDFQVGLSYSDPELTEGFIALKIKKSKGSSFYRVMFGPDERPYLELEGLMKDWLDLVPACQPGPRRCQAKLHVLNQSFFIDGDSLKMGGSLGEPVRLAPKTLAVKEDKLWLRYDQLPLWLPLNAAWNLETYQLNINPDYPLIAEQTANRKRLRTVQEQERQQREAAAEAPALTPESYGRTEFRYDLNREYFTREERGINQFGYELSSDLLKGQFLVSGSYQQEEATGTIPAQDSNQLVWSYRRQSEEPLGLIEGGDLLAKGGILFPNLLSTKSLHLKHKPEGQSAQEQSSIRGQSLPGSEVDLLINGFFIAHTQVGADGSYTFEQVTYKGGDQLRLVFYYPDGSSREEVRQIADDEGALLLNRDWDAALFSGETTYGRYSKLQLDYGLLSNLTIGGTAFSLPEEATAEPVLMPHFSWKPTYGLTLTTEWAQANQASNLGVQADFTQLQPHYFRMIWRNIEEGSPFHYFYRPEDQSVGYQSLLHQFGWGRWYWRGEIRDNDFSNLKSMSLRRHVNPILSLTYNRQLEVFKLGQRIESFGLGADVLSGKHNLHLEHNWNQTDPETNLSYRYPLWFDLPLDFSASSTYKDSGDLWFTAQLTYRPYQGVTTVAQSSSQGGSLRARYGGVWAPENGPIRYQDFAKGTLSGKVTTEPVDGGEPVPVEAVSVKAGGQSGVTDSKGEFMITGLPVHQRIRVEVDPSSLDVGMAPKSSGTWVVFRPSTQIQYNPKLVPTVGLDGMVVSNQVIPENTQIRALQLPEQIEVERVEVESDGFFVFEKLAAGDYLLELVDRKKPPKPFKIKIESNQVWVSEVQVPWP
ncbi:MAG: hypothetical protein RRB13_08795 [bacterium]|nr:hypothetical protein [bacterium]